MIFSQILSNVVFDCVPFRLVDCCNDHASYLYFVSLGYSDCLARFLRGTDSYYRHFTLYKHIFTTKVNVVIEQRHPHGVEEPPSLPSLSGALMMVVSPTRARETVIARRISLNWTQATQDFQYAVFF